MKNTTKLTSKNQIRRFRYQLKKLFIEKTRVNRGDIIDYCTVTKEGETIEVETTKKLAIANRTLTEMLLDYAILAIKGRSNLTIENALNKEADARAWIIVAQSELAEALEEFIESLKDNGIMDDNSSLEMI